LVTSRARCASTVVIAEGAQMEGDVVAEELAIGGHVKGTIHANRVTLNNTAVVEGDIFHRTLAIEENARFEGMSRRQENTIDTPSRDQAKRLQPQAADGDRKGNGASEKPTVILSADEMIGASHSRHAVSCRAEGQTTPRSQFR
jgi:cytoskeletal protein CcmA (bactofilin family)